MHYKQTASIPEPRADAQRNWKIILAESFRTIGDLLDFCEIEAAQLAVDGGSRMPLRVTRYYASLIEKGNPRDPLLLQVLPTVQERLPVAGYVTDAVGDHAAMPVPGLIHKYDGRVLLSVTGACAIHCRYCFRRDFPYGDAILDISPGGPVMRYLAGNTGIREVILSGGDPLMLADHKLEALVRALNAIPHLRVLRIHSRVPSVLPDRVDEGLLATLDRFAGRVVVVTHINHPSEISPPGQAAFAALAGRGYTLLNQSVLLKGVNDDAGTLAQLSHGLFENRVMPYYLHRLDKVQGAAHFDLPTADSERIYRQLRASLPGYLVPLMVDEVPGRRSKTPVACG